MTEENQKKCLYCKSSNTISIGSGGVSATTSAEQIPIRSSEHFHCNECGRNFTVRGAYFLWDYDLTETQIHQILQSKNEIEKSWILSRILESARFEDVWKYTTLKEVTTLFPKLKMKPVIKEAWQRALTVWQKPQYAN